MEQVFFALQEYICFHSCGNKISVWSTETRVLRELN